MTDLLYPFAPLLAGTLVRRYKRFFADVELDSGELITAHCPNTGPMTGVCILGNRVWVSQNDDPKRKLKYTWELTEVHDNGPTWVGVNTGLPNRVVRWLLENHLIAELGDYDQIRSEVKYGVDGRSRVDFVVQACDRPVYIEVKNTTWVEGRRSRFPDTVTTRGQKHIRELHALLPDCRAVMLYFVNRGDCTSFSPGDERDPTYGELLRQAVAAGLEVLPCGFEVSPQGVRYRGLLDLVL
ncbi:MAG: DNA/RNA nuclease SfsA [Synechococcales cyanobacterium RU_4_20]|nr:DNA/RNA nuclease SfsA [Synechococcales cyanobacterium RU_4_20]